jgi:predicted RND superfamily exporter protein
LLAIDPEVFRGVISVADILLPDASLPPKNEKEAAKLLTTKLGLLGLPAQAHILGNVWNRERKQMRLLLRVREGGDARLREQRFGELLAAGRASLGEQTYLTGPSHLMSRITQSLVATATDSVAWACVMMLVMLLLALRNPLLALLALMPTLLAVGSVLGVMGWLGLRIDMATALVASVAIGLSVDDSFHCLLRWRRERQGRSSREALRAAYSGSGPGVVVSSAAVSIGFTAQLFSDFLPTANFGWLIAVASLGGSVGNLVFVPACLALFVRERSASSE